ncbi:hypothetical protein ACTXT7_010925 [Hymenolepis weldensis]
MTHEREFAKLWLHERNLSSLSIPSALLFYDQPKNRLGSQEISVADTGRQSLQQTSCFEYLHALTHRPAQSLYIVYLLARASALIVSYTLANRLIFFTFCLFFTTLVVLAQYREIY